MIERASRRSSGLSRRIRCRPRLVHCGSETLRSVAVELILVRHAEAESRVSGDGTPADPGLTPRGQEQAEAAARWLAREPIDQILSSPSRRARETASPLASLLGVEAEIDSRFREIDDRAERYLSFEEERARDPKAYRRRVANYQRDPRLEALSERVESGLSDWIAKMPGGRIVVFCHGGVINVWTRRVLGLSPGMIIEAQNASSHRYLVSSQGVRSLQSLNETAYLHILPTSEPPDRASG